MNPNIPLFEHIANRADEMYADAVEKLLEHRRAGREQLANRQEQVVRGYLNFRRSAHRNLSRARAFRDAA